jgi:transposase
MRLYPLVPAEPTPTTRTYPSSLSDAEWAVLQPLVQRPATPQGGRPPKHPLRVIIDAIRYLVRTGCAWRLLPRDFPPPGTVYWWFAKWAADGTLERIHDGLRERVRVAAGRRAAPSAAVVDSQSVRAADTVPRASRGWDAGKKVNGRKRHLAVDTMGLLLVVLVTSACVQDRDAGRGATVAPARQPPEHPAGLGRWWLRRQAGRVGGVRAAPGGGDRAEAPWPVDL